MMQRITNTGTRVCTKILGSLGSDYKDCLLSCGFMKRERVVATFQTNLLPASTGRCKMFTAPLFSNIIIIILKN
jgi:hypothetical protein